MRAHRLNKPLVRPAVRRRRIGRAFLLTGALVLAIDVASRFRACIWRPGPYDRIGVDAGCLFVVVDWWWHGFELVRASPAVAYEQGLRLDKPFVSPGEVWHWWPHRGKGPFWGGEIFALPLWLPAALAFAVFALLRLTPDRDRDGRPRCRCGYDLTGNLSGRCPECGRDARPAGCA